MQNFKTSAWKSLKSLGGVMPILLGVVFLLGALRTLIPKEIYAKVFQGNLLDSVAGSAIGSIMAGNPITSYVLGGEFLNEGVSLIAVTAFLIAWVTVGAVQLPAEAMILGKRFSISRNIICFIFAIINSVIIVSILGIL